MLTRVLTTLHLANPDSLSRGLITGSSAAALLAINPILTAFHWTTISNSTIASVAGLIAVYVLQSGLHSAIESVVVPRQTSR
jgi:hypothetical protein